MKKRSTLTFLLGCVSLMLLCAATPAVCWQPTAPPYGPPAMGPGGPPFPPPGAGPMVTPFQMGQPCPPMGCEKQFSLEGGGRVFYTSNSAQWTHAGAKVDLVRDLNFSQNTTLGELYVAGRLCPWLAVTYNFMIPRDDRGNGVLPGTLTIGNTIFAAGEQVSVKSTTTIHRWEGELYPIVGCNVRLGALVLGELLVQRLRVESALAEDSESWSRFLMGVGGVAELGMAKNVFGRIKAAWMFLDDQNGVYLDGEGKYFPELGSGCGPGGGMLGGWRPYGGVGYRWRYSEWSKSDGNNKLTVSIHGPYAEVGVIF